MKTNNNEIPYLYQAVENLIEMTPPKVARILDKALSGDEITVEEGEQLVGVDSPSLLALMATADELRRRVNGDTVTYVVNRKSRVLTIQDLVFYKCGNSGAVSAGAFSSKDDTFFLETADT